MIRAFHRHQVPSTGNRPIRNPHRNTFDRTLYKTQSVHRKYHLRRCCRWNYRVQFRRHKSTHRQSDSTWIQPRKESCSVSLRREGKFRRLIQLQPMVQPLTVQPTSISPVKNQVNMLSTIVRIQFWWVSSISLVFPFVHTRNNNSNYICDLFGRHRWSWIGRQISYSRWKLCRRQW